MQTKRPTDAGERIMAIAEYLKEYIQKEVIKCKTNKFKRLKQISFCSNLKNYSIILNKTTVKNKFQLQILSKRDEDWQFSLSQSLVEILNIVLSTRGKEEVRT